MASALAGLAVSGIAAIGEVAVGAGAAAAELTGIEAVGTAVRGGIITGATDIVKGGIEQGTDAIFGEGTSKKIEEKIEESEDIAKELFSASVFDQEGRKGSIFERFGSGKKVISVRAKHSTRDTRPKFELEEARETTEKPKESIIIDNLMDVPHQTSEIIETFGTQEVVNHGQVAQDTGEFIVAFVNNLAMNDQYSIIDGKYADDNMVQGVLKNISKAYPHLAYLIPKVLEYASKWTVPSNANYQKIASVYDGKKINPSAIVTTKDPQGNDVFSMLDEEDQLVQWNTKLNTYTVVPPLYGTWVGINSPNNRPPGIYNDQGVLVAPSFLDTLAFMHDVSYSQIAFSERGDYQLVSRASQNKDRFVLPGELATANIAINYFSTLGSLMRAFFGDDIQAKGLVAKKTSQTPRDQTIIDLLLPQAKNAQESQEATIMEEFMDQVKEKVHHDTMNDSVVSNMAVMGGDSIKYKIAGELDQLQIEID
jgi:hypothetical protein